MKSRKKPSRPYEPKQRSAGVIKRTVWLAATFGLATVYQRYQRRKVQRLLSEDAKIQQARRHRLTPQPATTMPVVAPPIIKAAPTMVAFKPAIAPPSPPLSARHIVAPTRRHYAYRRPAFATSRQPLLDNGSIQ